MKKQIALLGIGTIGQGVYNLINSNKDIILHRDDIEFIIKKILVKDINKKRDVNIDKKILTNDFNEILNDDEITIVGVFFGVIHPTLEYIKKLLHAGKTVITANKQLLALHWPELEMAAKKTGAGLYYEAAVGGGIPIIRTINNSLQANRINKVMGIINGTTNFMLTKMSEEEISYDEILKKVIKEGLAEPDPSNDVEGFDAMYKLSILLSLAFHSKVPIEKIYTEGITNIKNIDINLGKQLGYELKLLAIGKRCGNDIEARIHPTFIPKTHPLASVRDSFNAIFIDGDAVGNLMLYGRGAGAKPTASAIISDMIFASKVSKHHYTSFVNENQASTQINFIDDWKCKYYMRLQAKDEPGVLSVVSGILGKHNVSLESVIQKGNEINNIVPVIFITHMTNEKSMMAAADEINNISEIDSIASIIRVEIL